MAKIFISYKYGDKYVRQNNSYNLSDWLLGSENGNYLTARDYVTHLMEKVLTDHTNKAEKDNEDLSNLTEDVIQQKLFDRIYDSTVTIVLISKQMKESAEEELQWIPRELSYSLKEKTREDRTSYTNGVLATALPDEDGSYDYAVINRKCGVISWQTQSFFKIIRTNMFNRVNKNHNLCNSCLRYHHHGHDHSFIHPVKWDDFVHDHNLYINRVLDFKDRLDEFKLTKNLE
ncbi:MAG: TIR domain-containing protein [Candidatus Pacebacteria bacterium]|nr:TIR domain-containing protein [Candidatus Paceibacterota bacterium]